MMKTALLLTTTILLTGWACGSAADAKTNWDRQCAKCHGAEGKGDTRTGQKQKLKDYSDPKVQAQLTDAELFKATKEGVKKEGKVVMKPARGLSDDEIKELVTLIRGFKK